MERLTKKLGPHPFSLLFTGLFAALFGALLVYLCIVLGRDQASVGLNLLVTLLGALSGWALGMFFSPIDATDAKSGTAEFKATAVRVERLNGGARQTVGAASGYAGEH